jgi:hypothetical protein
MTNPSRLAQAEQIMDVQQTYPFDDAAFEASWKEEVELLLAALKAETDEEALDLTRQYWLHREERRRNNNFTANLSEFERQREWLEGLAKYAELAIGRTAASAPGYEPFPDLQEDPEFNGYRTRERFWSLQLDQVRQILNNEGTIWFYYSGFAQAVLLDRLLPGWKESAMAEGKAPEDLLREAISQ